MKVTNESDSFIEKQNENRKDLPINIDDFKQKPTRDTKINSPYSLNAIKEKGYLMEDLYLVSLDDFLQNFPANLKVVYEKEEKKRYYGFLEEIRQDKIDKVTELRKMNKAKDSRDEQKNEKRKQKLAEENEKRKKEEEKKEKEENDHKQKKYQILQQFNEKLISNIIENKLKEDVIYYKTRKISEKRNKSLRTIGNEHSINKLVTKIRSQEKIDEKIKRNKEKNQKQNQKKINAFKELLEKKENQVKDILDQIENKRYERVWKNIKRKVQIEDDVKTANNLHENLKMAIIERYLNKERKIEENREKQKMKNDEDKKILEELEKQKLDDLIKLELIFKKTVINNNILKNLIIEFKDNERVAIVIEKYKQEMNELKKKFGEETEDEKQRRIEREKEKIKKENERKEKKRMLIKGGMKVTLEENVIGKEGSKLTEKKIQDKLKEYREVKENEFQKKVEKAKTEELKRQEHLKNISDEKMRKETEINFARTRQLVLEELKKEKEKVEKDIKKKEKQLRENLDEFINLF